ncbi:MAG: hypothetical protein JHC31_01545 [Sulfurihydrogenibium sp.]|jgi:nucleoid DNA-binding protein|nr:hypothetical protein [Sulfurihydrogenibium sp.]
MNVEEKIHKQLENFFGKYSNVPAFYHDAYQILKLKDKYPFKTSSHLIGHCLREIDSAIREILREKREKTREAEIEKIINGILSMIEDDENKKKKIKLKAIGKIWNKLELHKCAHRNNIESPRDIKEIEEVFEYFSKVLFTLLPYLLKYVDEIKRRIDKLVDSKDKTEVLGEFGRTIPKSPYFLNYFFDKIDSSWLSILKEKGFFENPPELYKEDIYNLTWPQIKFLERIVKKELTEKDYESRKKIIEEVIDCILDMKENKNAIVLHDLIKIIAEIPLDSLKVDNEKIKELSEKIYKWMDKSDYLTHTYLIPPNTFWKAIINITKADVESGLTLIKYLLDDNKYESEVRHFLLYREEILMKLYPELISITKLQGFELLCSLLEKEIQYNDPNIPGEEDYSYRWYNTEKEHRYRLRGILVASILENAKFMIENDISSLESILNVIENRQFKVFCRIARDIIEPYKNKSEKLHKKYEEFADQCKKEDEIQTLRYWTPLIDDIHLEYIDKFSYLKVFDIINELRKHEEPDYSIADALEQVIKDNPEKFMKEIDNFIGIHPVYQEHLIKALHVLLLSKKSVPFDWEKILKLIKEIIYRENNKEDVLLATARLINHTLKKNLIPIDYKNELWEIIDRILDKLKTNNKQLEYAYCHIDTSIISTLEGLSTINLILYLYWLKKNNEIENFNSIPEVKDKLEYYLNKQTSIIIHAVYGFCLLSLLYIDKHWTKNMIYKIFPTNNEEYFFGAWCAYIKSNYPDYETYSLLKDIYAYAIENMKYNIEESECEESECHEDLVHHLVFLYGWGIISLDEPVFQRFWEKANDNIRGYFIRYAGQQLKGDEIPRDIIQRFKELWKWRLDYIRNTSNKNDFQKELENFIEWMNSKKLDDKWALENLIETIKLSNSITYEHISVLETLIETVNKFPELVLNYLELLIYKVSEIDLNLYLTEIKKFIEEISEILKSNEKNDLKEKLKNIKGTINLRLEKDIFLDLEDNGVQDLTDQK